MIRTKLLNFINNLKPRLYIAYFSRYWSSCLCPKLRKGILRKIRIFEKPLVVKPSELFCFKDNKFYFVITFSQRYKQTVNLGKIFWTQFDCMTNKKPNSLGIKIYGKYQWIKKFDKHLYPILYTAYAIKKNMLQFCMTIPVIRFN